VAVSKFNLFLKKEQIYARTAERALQSLDGIDGAFQDYIHRWEVAARKFCGKSAKRKPLEVQKIASLMSKLMDACLLNDVYIVSSNGEPVFVLNAKMRAEWLKLMKLDYPVRKRILDRWLSNGAELDLEQLCVLGRKENGHPLPNFRISDSMRQKVLKAFGLICGEVFRDYNSKHGFDSEPLTGKVEIPLENMIGSEFETILKVLRSNISTMRLVAYHGYYDYFFTDIIPGPDGRAKYFFSFTASSLSLEAQFLSSRVFRRRSSKSSSSLLAIPFPEVVARTYPSMSEATFFLPILREASRENKKIFFKTLNRNGVEFFAVFKKGVFLRSYFLVHETPVSLLEEELKSYRYRSWFFVIGSGIFGFLLAWFLIQRLLVPLGEISEGVQALREKKFDHRLKWKSFDELGQFCDAFNETILLLKEMEIAAVIQRDLYPHGSMTAGNFLITGRNKMMQAVGGDYYDFITLPDGKVAVVIGDVSGHGFSAAIVTAMAKAAFTILCPIFPENPVAVLEKINQQFLQILNKKKMMTCFLGILDPASEKLFAANAGQCFPLFLEKSGQLKFLEFNSFPLGILRKAKFPFQEVSLKDGMLVLYSDGLIESVNESNQGVGYARFAEIVKQKFTSSGKLDISEILEGVREFTGSVPWNDDATTIVIQKITSSTSRYEPFDSKAPFQEDRKK